MKQASTKPLISMSRRSTSLSLPKGGGAIRGVDEDFSVNGANGTAGLSVPIFVSPSRGFTPSLALSYDSGAGNGAFGFGWSLGLPSISRSTQKRLPTYRDIGPTQDSFLLDNVEELVPTLVHISGSWKPDILTRIEDGSTYDVKRYRPRTEGRFLRIERWTEQLSGSVHWRTISKDNQTAIFGRSTQAQITDPNDSHRIFRWLLEEQFDDKGHITQYQYASEDLSGVNQRQVNEAHRIAGRVGPSQPQKYLKRILYGNKRPFSRQDWLFELILDYGEHPDLLGGVSYDATLPWTVRQDSFSTYRPGFELRTYRLCRRILMFHHIDALRTQPTLVRSTDFVYDEHPAATRLTHVGQTGYVWKEAAGHYTVRSMPSMEFTFSQSTLDASIVDVSPDEIHDVPEGAIASVQWVDLEGEGLPGMLLEQDGALYYKHNLGGGSFGPLKRLNQQPNLQPGQGRLMDLAGDGRLEMVKLDAVDCGFFTRSKESWRSYQSFVQQPSIQWDDPNLRFIDLDGDGRADLLLTEESVLRWYPSLGEKGFDSARWTPMELDEIYGPTVVFEEPFQSVFLADMSGDGLTDIVRIRNGDISYWPNLGYGQFGARVTMANAPRFDHPDRYDPRFVRLADVDGSGPVDLLYLRPNSVSLWSNQSGNVWSAEEVLSISFPVDNLSNVTVTDLKGNGTACLVWSSPLPDRHTNRLRFVDLLGEQKPYLLTGVKDNMGSETRISYAPSTKFYLQDKLSNKPWVTRLPFPVHVVERVEHLDHLAKTKLCTRYAYHHGYYDGEEREFRGFGSVEQWDTELFSKYSGSGLFTETPVVEGEEFHLPPVRTISWFHTGAFFEKESLEEHYRTEYYQGDSLARELSDTVLPLGLTPEEARQACRALRGGMLRQEVYAEDGSPAQEHPYTVTESNAQVHKLQPARNDAVGVFSVHPLESISFQYERNPSDPRVMHELTLEIDAFGYVTQTAQVAYPRRQPAADMPEQNQLLVTSREDLLVHVASEPSWYRIGVPQESRLYEITGLTSADITPRNLLQKINSATQIDYEKTPTSGVEKRLLQRTRALYSKNDQTGALAAGQIESLGLPYENYEQIFTPGLLQDVFDSKVTHTMLEDAKYQLFESVWWAPSGRVTFDSTGFYVPTQETDPLGNSTSITYDSDFLLPVETTDPLGNTIAVQNDYRVLQPWELTDPNGNRSQAAFDALGMMVGSAVMGKVTESLGDSLLGFEPDLTQAEIDAYLNNPLAQSHHILKKATSRFIYDVGRYQRSGQPNVTCSLLREIHDADLEQGQRTTLQQGFMYSDGSGRKLMTKGQAESGLAPKRDVNGSLVFDDQGSLIMEEVVSRWIGTGATIYDNKGNSVKAYEPFFSSTHEFEEEKELRHWGVTSLVRYDAVGRAVRTEMPDGTFSRVAFDTWKQSSYDATDTVLNSAWYIQRGSPSPTSSEPTTPDARAAYLTAQHADQPSVTHFDVLGRAFLTEESDGNTLLRTRAALNIEGHLLSTTDARGNIVMSYTYDMRGPNAKEQESIEKGEGEQTSHQVYTKSMDAGERWILRNVIDNPMDSWDSRGFHFETEYDALTRATHQRSIDVNNHTKLLKYTVYGESLGTHAATTNHRGKVLQQYDGAGVHANVAFDFKGNVLEAKRQFAQEYKQTPDWTALGSLTDPTLLASAAASLLENEVFISKATFDALNRVVTQETPDASITRHTYNEAGLLNAIDVQLRGEVDANSQPMWTSSIGNIDYDAKGQREKILRGNGVETSYTYDPHTYRLTRILSKRSNGNVLQDIAYTYDASGNITEQTNSAQNTIFYDNEQVAPTWRYVYDALHRLVEVKGREHAGQLGTQQRDATQLPQVSLASPSDPQAMRKYTQAYTYDGVGNIIEMKHSTKNGGWTRKYVYETFNNRLLSTSIPGDDPMLPLPTRYQYDPHGNMSYMPHLPSMNWNEEDLLQSSSRQVMSNGTPETTYYVYDASGQRVRKITENQAIAGSTPTRKNERLYLGRWEIFRDYEATGSSIDLERESLSVMDDQQRVSMVETKTIDNGSALTSPMSITRVQLEDHLGSSVLEVTDDTAALVLSYEEHHPFGTSSYRAKNSALQASTQRYRYTGKERDEENGFTYHGARYYAPWLGRWTAPDPAGMIDGPNLYAYVNNQPIILFDPDGNAGKKRSFWSWRSLANRAVGLLQVAGGITEAIVGGAGVIAPEPITTGMGVLLVAHGADTTSAGLRTIWTGEIQQTLTQKATTKTTASTLRTFGASKKTAKFWGQQAGATVDMGIGIVAPAKIAASTVVKSAIQRKSVQKGLERQRQKSNSKIVLAAAVDSKKVKGGSIRSINRKGGPGRTHNCPNCSIATDLTLSGRKTSALPGVPAYMEEVAEFYGRKGKYFIFYPSISSIRNRVRQIGNGARGIIYGGRPDGSAHFFNVINQNGKIRFLDGQTGRNANTNGYNLFYMLRTDQVLPHVKNKPG